MTKVVYEGPADWLDARSISEGRLVPRGGEMTVTKDEAARMALQGIRLSKPPRARKPKDEAPAAETKPEADAGEGQDTEEGA